MRFHYVHRQECLCYVMKSGFGGADTLVCVPNYYRSDGFRIFIAQPRHEHNRAEPAILQ